MEQFLEQFLKNFCEMLELETLLSPGKLLSEIDEWDSLAIVTFIAMVDLKYKKTIQFSDIKKASTVLELHDLVQS